MCRSYFVEYRARGCGPSCQTTSYHNCSRQRKTRNCLDLEIYPTWITNNRCPYHVRMKREDEGRFYAELREQDKTREEEEERKRRKSQEGIQRLEMGEERGERHETRTREPQLAGGTGTEGASTAENGKIQKSRKVESGDDEGIKMSKSSERSEKQRENPHRSSGASNKLLDVRAPDSSPSVAVPSLNSSIPLPKAVASSPSTNVFNPSAPACRSIIATPSRAYAPPFESLYSPMSPQSSRSSSSSQSLICPYNTPPHLLLLKSSMVYNSKIWEPLFQLIDSKEVSFVTEERKGGFGSSMFEYTGVGNAEGGVGFGRRRRRS